MKNIKKIVLAILVIVGAVFLVQNFSTKKNKQTKSTVATSTEVFNVEGGGYGYIIKARGEIFIKQATIPAIPGNIPFKTEEEALLVGKFVENKLLNKEYPSVSISELSEMNIDVSNNLN
jgi:hypothetical protein